MNEYKKIHEAINRAQKGAFVLEGEVNKLKWIVFSDHHRGRRDKADDFADCEEAYINALNYYYKQGYTLILLGDVEEFWENPLSVVLKSYENILKLEKKFHDEGRLYKVWGNHDDHWRFQGTIAKYLSLLLPDINVYEALKLKVNSGEERIGEILLLHGHQGTLLSERFAWISKLFVKYFWRNIQRIFRIPLSTPRNDIGLKSEHDKAMYSWAARQHRKLIVTGHTHQPVFMSKTHIDVLLQEIQALQIRFNQVSDEKEVENIKEIIKKKNELIKEIRTKCTALQNTIDQYQPVYFNSGCCSFADGDITGIEISNGEIMLVKWDAQTKESPQLLESSDICEVFAVSEL